MLEIDDNLKVIAELKESLQRLRRYAEMIDENSYGEEMREAQKLCEKLFS